MSSAATYEGMDPEPTVEVGDTRFHVGRVRRAIGFAYDVSSDDGDLLARVSRDDEEPSMWTVERWSDTIDAETAEDIVRVAFERRLLSGHTGYARGLLVSVERGFASVELACGSEVWVPCPSAAGEVVARMNLARGRRAVTVDMLDGVPVGFEPREESMPPASGVSPRASLFHVPTLRMRRSG